MKRVLSLSTLILASGALASWAATSYNVKVLDSLGSPIAQTQVVALNFGPNGPDPNNTKLAVTDANGVALFSLTDEVPYEIFVTSQGYLPSIRDQFNNPEHLHIFATPPTLSGSTLTLSNIGVASVGEIDVDVAGATANTILFGNVQPAGTTSGKNAAAYGMAATNGSGDGTFYFLNVH
ncbi:MAG: hypothetical protein HY551_07020, partial [Elusimicrobia bacterium]|nr:hypothetical protein [Elusimicrobiota bacterium]